MTARRRTPRLSLVRLVLALLRLVVDVIDLAFRLIAWALEHVCVRLEHASASLRGESASLHDSNPAILQAGKPSSQQSTRPAALRAVATVQRIPQPKPELTELDKLAAKLWEPRRGKPDHEVYALAEQLLLMKAERAAS